MRFPLRVLWALAWLTALGGQSAWAQSGTPSSGPPSSTRQVPYHHAPEHVAKPPVTPPRQSVHKAEGPHAGKAPVVAPRGPNHPHKPDAAVRPGKIVPPPATSAERSPDTKAAQSETSAESAKRAGASGKLPRFATLRSDDVNMRAGPGTRYRIEWVYKRRDLPVEIEREFDVWRWIRDVDGVQGWVHQATLTGRRGFIVQTSDATLRSEPRDSAPAVAILKHGVIGRIRSCEASSDWCDVQTGSYRGYLRREQFWGVLKGEAVNP